MKTVILSILMIFALPCFATTSSFSSSDELKDFFSKHDDVTDALFKSREFKIASLSNLQVSNVAIDKDFYRGGKFQIPRVKGTVQIVFGEDDNLILFKYDFDRGAYRFESESFE